MSDARRSPSTPAWRPLAVVGLTALAATATGLLVSRLALPALRQVLVEPGPDVKQAVLLGLMGLTFAVALAALLALASWLGRRPPRSLVSSGPPSSRELWLGVAAWAPLALLQALLIHPEGAADLLGNLQRSTFLVLGLAAMSSLAVQASFEEVLFRGYLLSELDRRWGPRWAPVVATAGLFALFHLGSGVQSLLESLAFATVMALLARARGGIELTVGVHFAHNLVLVLVGGASQAEASFWAVDVVELGAALGSLLALLALVRALPAPARLPARSPGSLRHAPAQQLT